MTEAPRSFAHDDGNLVVDAQGRLAHRGMFEQSRRLVRQLYAVGDSAWCLVGNGLSNQSFVRGPEGIIAIDTGESVEEMRAALVELRSVTPEPIVAVLYTHFHYVQGTQAVLEDRERMGLPPSVPVYGHERIAANLARTAAAIGPTYSRGLVEQFGTRLPADGPDGLVNVGLGLAYRNAEHAPFTLGHLPVSRPFSAATTLHVAGLRVDVQPAPSDADDSVTFWFPSLKLAVHNIVWPVLFNVFAIRGEEYRDPQVLLTGIDHLLGLDAEHLIAAHGPPMSYGREIRSRVTKYRDAIQFLWDQTVRHTNAGASSVDLAHLVRLPEEFDDDFITTQYYGVVEHHARQIRSGLFGFFDGDPVNLFPLPRTERANRLIKAMGGVDAVRAACSATKESDPRWALELAGLLAAGGTADESDGRLLAEVLRVIARRTTAANIRNWCLTRAREADGSLDTARLYQHRWSRRQLAAWGLRTTLEVLRVTLVPERARGVDVRLELVVGEESAVLHVRNSVAFVGDSGADRSGVADRGAGVSATARVALDTPTWLDIMSGTLPWASAVAAGRVTIDGSADRVAAAWQVFDHPALSAMTPPR
jgi:alkyl sulfatase BDS1-like metallo-beta-lactamase superfamily hydrolase